MALTTLIAEVPTGVVADAVSRKRSLVIAHAVMGSGMVMMGFVTAFPLILITQVLWGLGWTFSSGADVAWVTDELDETDRISEVLITSARWEQFGAIAGTVAFGGLAWATDLSTAIVVAGGGMLLLGLLVATRFTERNFTPVDADRLAESAAILRRGLTLARGDRQLLTVFAATFLVNGGAAAFSFLYKKQLLELGFPTDPDPIVWFSVLGLVTLAVGAIALRIAQTHIEGDRAAPRAYALAAILGVVALTMVAHAPNQQIAIAGVLLVTSITFPVTRAVGVIWVNRRTTNDVRATVHSLLAQSESFGELICGFGLALVALASGIGTVLVASAALVGIAAVLVIRVRTDDPSEAATPPKAATPPEGNAPPGA